MNVALCYVFPDLDHQTYIPLARRFVDTYVKNPPGDCDHSIHVLVNMGEEKDIKAYRRLFSPLECQFIMHNNYGKDIGAYQLAARTIDCDLMICFGAPVHFHKPGWMDRIAITYDQNGPALYGAWGFELPGPHIRTTAFWLPPEILNSYPSLVSNGTRYEFEHGTNSIHRHVEKLGLESFMTTWTGCYARHEWRHASRDESLILDQHSEK